MGDPRKARKKYRTPGHPWKKERLEEENQLAIEYGLKNKKEIWIMNTILSNYAQKSKKLVTMFSVQAEKEKLQLIKKLKKLALLKESDGFEDILSITIKDIMERRLQTLVHRKGLAKTMKQARQFIVHSHIMVGDKKIKSPSYLLSVEEESKIGFISKSALASLDHPERKINEKLSVKKKKVSESKDKKDSSKSSKHQKPKYIKKEKKTAEKSKLEKKEAKSIQKEDDE
jgi:small subunit ribosomal protein S4